MNIYDYLVVGSGFYGVVMAEQIRKAGKSVLVLEKREHIGGNCYSYEHEGTDIPIHKYGTHVFRTSNRDIWQYINGFGTFNRYQHRVLTTYRNKVFSMPINLGTINSFYGINLKPFEVEEFMTGKRGNFPDPQNLEEKAITLIGEDLYKAFFRGYTIKQWDRDPKELPADIINRLPVRKSYYDSYYDDIYQGVPIEEYTNLFKSMLQGIPVEVNTDFLVDREYWQRRSRKVIYTGPIDRYFEYAHGELGWRSVHFETELIDVDDFQGTSVMNYADIDVPYTRIHEPKHLHPEKRFMSNSTVVIREYSASGHDEPFYPVNSLRDREIYQKYAEVAGKETKVVFGGRLAEYKYYAMHEVVEKALKDVKELITGRP
jgi:UDP-galactopyranose mutase